jgi:hypothetical protein
MISLRMKPAVLALVVCATLTTIALVINAEASDIKGLDAAGPAAEHADKLMLFGQFVGDWEFDYVGYGRDGRKFNGQGEWHFGWVLEGRAVQDTWIIPRRVERNKPGASAGEYGTTVRFYDPKLDAWRVVWTGPVHGEVLTFVARKVGDEIVMEGQDGDGAQARWIFSKITAQSFYWHSVASLDGGKTWQLREEMFVRRVKAE